MFIFNFHQNVFKKKLTSKLFRNRIIRFRSFELLFQIEMNAFRASNYNNE